MYNKFIRILRNFYKTAKLKEILELHGTALVLTFFLIVLFINKIKYISKFAVEFNNSTLTITTLLGAFGIATITILLTSSSDNIRVAKEKTTKRVDINGHEISYYKLLVIRNFYNLLLQLGMLFTAVIYQVILLRFSDSKLLVYIEVFMLLNMLVTQIFVVISLYHLLARDEEVT